MHLTGTNSVIAVKLLETPSSLCIWRNWGLVFPYCWVTLKLLVSVLV